MAKKKQGRPKAFTPAKRKAFIEAVEIGGSLNMAAKCVGISYTTFKVELQNNKAFRDQVEKAKAARFLAIHRQIKKTLPKASITGLARLLKVLYPDLYQQRKKVQHKGSVEHVHSGGVTVQQVLLAITGSDIERIECDARERLLRHDAGLLCGGSESREVEASQSSASDRPSDLRDDPKCDG